MTNDDLRIVLTNDDGIESPGLVALYERLSSLGDVTTIAPMAEQSGIGRAVSVGRGRGHQDRDEDGVDVTAGRFSCTIPHHKHDLGYAVEGTPCDCVMIGIHALKKPPDIVVAGCNPGPNVGRDTLSRSGTTSSAMEAAYASVPAVATSVNTVSYERKITKEIFERNARLVTDLVRQALNAGIFEEVDYLNVNGPRPDRPVKSIEMTQPTPKYGMGAELTEGEFRIRFDSLERFERAKRVDPPGSDLRAVVEGRVSISPLRLPADYQRSERLRNVIEEIV